MKKHDASHLRVFIAASANQDLGVLRDELTKRGVVIFTAYDLSPATGSLVANIQQAIENSDLVIAVVPQEPSPNVFFEIGIASALRKPSLLLVSPKYGQVPSDLANTLYVRADVQDTEAIGFALDQCLSRMEKRIARPPRLPQEGHPLGDKADGFLARVKTGSAQRGRGMESLVAEVLQAAGLRAVTQSPRPDRGVDIAVWSDALQPITGNPLLIEVKSSIQGRRHLLEARDQLEQYRVQSGSRMALLIINAGSLALSSMPFVGGVLTITLDDLINSLRTRTFAETVRELRNQRVHDGSR